MLHKTIKFAGGTRNKELRLSSVKPTSPTETKRTRHNFSANVDLNLSFEQTELLTE